MGLTSLYRLVSSSHYLHDDSNLLFGLSLEYNCYYLTAICQNANNYITGTVGSARQVPGAFGFDFNKDRKDGRRDKACNDRWYGHHNCPEVAGVPPGNVAQPSIFRDDGLAWPYTALEPGQGTGGRVVQHRRNGQGQVIEPSGVYYTCDEFPAATWIQGGAGTPANGNLAETRCAAFRCNGGVGRRAEQNWQALGHQRLRAALRQVAVDCVPGWTPADEPLLFFFRMRNSNNGLPVRIVEADGGGDERNLETVDLKKRANLEDIKAMRKRSLKEFMMWADTVPLEKLKDYGFGVKTHHIFENETTTTSDFSDTFGQMNMSSMVPRSEQEDRSGWSWTFDPRADISVNRNNIKAGHHIHARDHVHNGDRLGSLRRADNNSLRGGAKNVTASEIAAATRIVEEALNRSAEYNKARWENMSRNQYRLKPGTIIEGMESVPDSALNKRSVIPDFEVTPEIEAAAALLAEVEASGLSGNNETIAKNRTSTGRIKIAAASSFWMESIARKGTVPWGNDPGYKVSGNFTPNFQCSHYTGFP